MKPENGVISVCSSTFVSVMTFVPERKKELKIRKRIEGANAGIGYNFHFWLLCICYYNKTLFFLDMGCYMTYCNA
jgi:hypothetical protein